MNINRKNYEIFFLDYHEGRLKPGQVAELLVFLEANPDLKYDFEDFENILITPDSTISFTGKMSLKKNIVPDFGPINASNFETYFIADTEKQLTPEEQRWLAGFLERNPALSGVYELYLSTRLQPDMQIQYPGKAGLKRSIFNTRRIYYYAASAAAAIALLFAVYMNSGTNREPALAARQNTLSNPVPGNHSLSPSVAQQNHSAPAMGANREDALNQVVADQQANQPVAGKTQSVVERKSLAAIQPRQDARITSRDIVEPEYIFIRQSRNNPHTYATLYDQINLAERMQNEQVLAPVVSSHKSLLRTGLAKLGSIITGKEVPPTRGTFNFWTLADLGISGFNLLTDKDVKLLTQSNDSGKVVSYALRGDEFEFIRQQNKAK